jgi:hypothetical protein
MTREMLHDLLLSFVNKETSASRGHRRTAFVKLQRFATKKGIEAPRPWKSVAADEWRAARRIAEEDDGWSTALIGGPLRSIFKFILIMTLNSLWIPRPPLPGPAFQPTQVSTYLSLTIPRCVYKPSLSRSVTIASTEDH